MRIEIYPYIATLLKLTLPINLPGNPCFPSGDLPGLGVFCKLSVFSQKTNKKQGLSAPNGSGQPLAQICDSRVLLKVITFSTNSLRNLLQTGLDSHWPRS